MFAEGKDRVFFFMADEYCRVFNRMLYKYFLTDKSCPPKRSYHRDSTMPDAEVMVITRVSR